MKKIVGIVFIMIGIVTFLIGMVLFIRVRTNAPSSIAIIGGADVPTSIFLASRIAYPIYGSIIVGAIVFLIGLILVLIKRK